VTTPPQKAAGSPANAEPSLQGHPPQPGYVTPPPGYAYPPPGYQVPPGYAVPPPAYRVVLPPLSPGGQRLAEFGDRALAFIIDMLIIGAINIVITVPVYVVMFLVVLDPVQTTTDPFTVIGPLLGTALAVVVLSLLAAYVYEVELMYRTGQTVGKRAMKLRIVPLDPAVTLTRQMAFKRFLVQHVATIFLPGLNWVDGLWQLWDKPYRQCLHDKFAETVVIKLDS
jgi:uncharacterized RDD family membrane protein YckC